MYRKASIAGLAFSIVHLCAGISEMVILPTCPFAQRFITWIRPCTSPVVLNIRQPDQTASNDLRRISVEVIRKVSTTASPRDCSFHTQSGSGREHCMSNKRSYVPQWNTKPCFEAGEVILYRCISQFMLSDHGDMGFEIEIFRWISFIRSPKVEIFIIRLLTGPSVIAYAISTSSVVYTEENTTMPRIYV